MSTSATVEVIATDNRPQNVEFHFTDDVVVAANAECHRCEEWPTTVIDLTMNKSLQTNNDVFTICIPCIVNLLNADYAANA